MGRIRRNAIQSTFPNPKTVMSIKSLLSLISVAAFVAPCFAQPGRAPGIQAVEKQAAQGTDIFGIEMLRPLKGFGECATKLRPDYLREQEPTVRKEYAKLFLSAGEPACFKRLNRSLVGSSATLGTEAVSIHWSSEASPDMVGVRAPEVELLGGVVHRVKLETRGLSTQEEDFLALTQKFGRPPSFSEPIEQN